MSTVISISTRRRYGVARICRIWGVTRAGVYRRRGAAEAPPTPRRRPGPQGPMSDTDLVDSLQRLMPALDGGDDVLRSGFPDEGLGALIVLLDELLDGALQCHH